MQELISVIIKEPNKDPERKVIKNTLEAMQSIVEGNIEIVPLASEVLIVCNEESLIHHLPYNCTLDHHSIYGTFFLCGFEGENLCSLPEEYEMGKGGE